MGDEYEFDWENPSLAIEGFITDYIVWRLAKDGLEWYESPGIPEDADEEHHAMRAMCEIFEEKNSQELREIGEELGNDTLTFARFVEVVDQFGRKDDEIPDEMTFGRMVALVTFVGSMCLEKAKKNERRDIGLLALYMSKFIDRRIRDTWAQGGRSWGSFMNMYRVLSARHAAHKQSKASLPSPSPPSVLNVINRRNSLLVLAGASAALGVYATVRHVMMSR